MGNNYFRVAAVGVAQTNQNIVQKVSPMGAAASVLETTGNDWSEEEVVQQLLPHYMKQPEKCLRVHNAVNKSFKMLFTAADWMYFDLFHSLFNW